MRWARVGGRETGTLLNAGSAAVYLSEGYVLVARGGSLLGQRFDADRLRLVGQPVVVSESVGVYGEDGPTGLGMFSGRGDAVALMDSPAPAQQLSWFDREGRRLGTVGPPGDYRKPDISPDGTRAAVVRIDPRKRASDVVVFELVTGIQTHMTDDPQPDSDPIWSPRGDRLAFGSLRDGRWRSFVRDTTRAGEETALPDVCIVVNAWLPDGRSVVCTTLGATTSLLKVDVDGDASPTRIIDGLGFADARVSPDGSWLAYSSDHQGRRQVYVLRLSNGVSKSITLGAGGSPRWRSDRRELFFLSGRTMMSVSVNAGEAFSQRRLFNAPVYATDSLEDFTPSFAVSPDGSRFLLITPNAAESPAVIRILSPFSSVIHN